MVLRGDHHRIGGEGSTAENVSSTLGSVLRMRSQKLDPVARRLRGAASIADLRSIAKGRLPAGVFDYVDGGAEDEVTLERNVAAFRRLQLRPRVLRGLREVDPSGRLLGKPVPLPLVLAPTGFTRMVDHEGELAVARAAAGAGLPYTLSTLATRSIEEVAAVSSGPKWFQVYIWRDHSMVEALLDRAAAAGYEAVVVTVDTPVLGRRERDLRRGFTLPPQIGLDTIVDGLRHPRWTWGFVRSDPIVFSNVVGSGVGDGRDPVRLADYIGSQLDPAISWRDLEWIRSTWRGPVIIKGIQSVADAIIAADLGVEAIAVSNHGGRQLDGTQAPVDLLASISAAVGERVGIICDGGVRRGSDIVKAVALGADACMIGRAYLYGLAVAGERGVDHALSLLREGVVNTMALLGVASMAEVNPELVDI
jgi:L-lactate dehydrogenase (cytochrome)